MSNAAAISSREQALAGALALVMHVLLLVLLVFSVNWQRKQIDTGVVVDLWRDLPVAPPRAEAPPAPKPEPPPPAPKVETKPPPAVKPAPEPAPAPRPDIALKEKQEKERKLKEQQAAEAKKLAAEKSREAELDKKKRAEAEVLKKKQTADAEAKRAVDEQQKARDALAAQQAAAAKRDIDKYMDGIRSKVKPYVRVPDGLQGNPEAEFTVTLLPGGEVLDVKLSKSSGNATYDKAIENAIIKAQPFVVPTGGQFQQHFRRFTMAFRPIQ